MQLSTSERCDSSYYIDQYSLRSLDPVTWSLCDAVKRDAKDTMNRDQRSIEVCGFYNAQRWAKIVKAAAESVLVIRSACVLYCTHFVTILIYVAALFVST